MCKSIKTPSFTEHPAAAQPAKEHACCLLALLTSTHCCCWASAQREIARHASSFVGIHNYQHYTTRGTVQQSRDALFASEHLKIQHTAIEATLINYSNYFGSIWEWKALFSLVGVFLLATPKLSLTLILALAELNSNAKRRLGINFVTCWNAPWKLSINTMTVMPPVTKHALSELKKE